MILIIDDEEMVRTFLARLLQRALPAMRIEVAADGEAGLTIFRSERPLLVITDLNMLGTSGLDVVRAIRERDATLPIILMTGAPSEQPVDAATEVLPKIEFQQLIKRAVALVGGGAAPAS